MSTFSVCSYPFNISGAKYSLVPQKVIHLCYFPLTFPTRPVNPKSHNLNLSSSPAIIFSGLISRWTIFLWWIYATASIKSIKILMISWFDMFVFWIRSKRVPFGKNSKIMYSFPSFFSDPYNLTIWGWSSWEWRFISLYRLSYSFLLTWSHSMILTAYFFFVTLCSA